MTNLQNLPRGRAPAPPAPMTAASGRIDGTARWVLLATSLANVVVILDVTVVNVALRRIGTTLHAGVSDLQWVLNAYTLVFATLLLSGGALSDRFGARRVFVCGFAVFTGASAACALAGTVPMLVAARAVQGIGAALCIPTSLALLHDSFPAGAPRTHAVSIWGGIGGLALAAGPVLGGLMIDRLGWPSIFLLNVPVGVAAIALALAFAPPARPRRERGLDPAGQVLATAALAGVAVACIEAAPLGWRHPLVIAGLLCSAATLPAFLAVEHRSRSPMLPLSLFRSAQVGAGCFIGATFNFSYYGFLFVLSLFFQDVRGYSPLVTGLAFLPMTMLAVGVNLLAGRLIARVGPRGPLLAGQLVTAAGFLLLIGLGAKTPYALIVLPMLAVGVGPALSLPAYTLVVLEDVPAERAGVAAGALNAARQSGGVLGVGLFGSLVAGRGVVAGMAPALALATLVLAAGLVASLIWVRAGRGPGGREAAISVE